MKSSTTNSTYCIGRRAVEKGPRFAVQNQAAGNAKSATGYSIVTRRRKKLLEDQKEQKKREEFKKDRNLLKCKKNTKVATLNVRTLEVRNTELEDISQNFKLGELAAEAELSEIDILCIQEHRILHENVDFKYHNVGKGWVFATSSAWKNSANASNGGVGFLLSSRANKSLKNIEKITPRIITATFHGNPALSVVCCYSPTNCSDPKIAEDFYEVLTDVQKAAPKHNVLLTCGDFNAQVKEESVFKRSYNKETNRNGNLLLDLAIENEQIPLNSYFLKKNSKLWTFTYPNQSRTQIDYILINKKWVKSATNCQTYNSFAQIGSDHKVVVANLQLKLRAPKENKVRQKAYNWGLVVNDGEVHDRFSVEVKNRFNALQILSDDGANTRFDNIVQACDEAAQKCVPEKPKKKKRVPWDSEEMKTQRKALKTAQETENKRKVAKEKKKLKEIHSKEMTNFFQKKICDINNAPDSCRHGVAWGVINEITNRKKSATSRLKGSSGNERKGKFFDHFKNLLGKNPSTDGVQGVKRIVDGTLPIPTSDFTREELEITIKSLPSGKACGLDRIPVEVWKNGALNEELLTICNDLLRNGTAPDYWRKSCIIPIPKKGDLGLPSNYRGISLTSTAAKIFNKMILLRIRPEIEKVLRKNQNGFRPGRSTTTQVLSLRRLIEGITEKQLTAILLFVDFSKAFDSIHRGTMLSILRAYGIPEVLIRSIGALYEGTTSTIRTPDGDTDFFQVLAGVLQGDTLAPYLFVIVLDYVLRTSIDENSELGFTLHPRRSRRHPATILTDADFADDLALLADNSKDAEALLVLLEVAAEAVGLQVNYSKTNYMVFQEVNPRIKGKNGEELEAVNDFKYLGSWLASSSNDMGIRIAQAWSAHNKLDKIWRSTLTRGMKIRLFQSLVLSILLYGAETWTLTKTKQRKLDGVFTRMLRKTLGLTWEDMVPNKELYGDLPTLSSELRQRRLRFSGHCWRRTDEICSQMLMWQPPHGKRRRGAPKRTYIDMLEEDTELQREDLQNLMKDRVMWRSYVDGIRDTPSRPK